MRPIDLSLDYPVLETWWRIHKWPPPPAHVLSPHGLIIEGKAAGFLYLNEGGLAILEFVVANPLCDKLERGKALDLIINGLVEKARQAGKAIIISSITNPSLMKRYEASGAVVGDRNMTNYVWRL